MTSYGSLGIKKWIFGDFHDFQIFSPPAGGFLRKMKKKKYFEKKSIFFFSKSKKSIFFSKNADNGRVWPPINAKMILKCAQDQLEQVRVVI